LYYSAILQWINFLKGLKITGERHKRIATERALTGSVINHGFNPDLAIISDDVGKGGITRFLS